MPAICFSTAVQMNELIDTPDRFTIDTRSLLKSSRRVVLTIALP